MTRPLHERFWEKVDRRGPDECWPWLASKTPDGYGKIKNMGISYYAHHVALKLINRLPKRPSRKLHVRHSCDNPPCCNPAHLILGTAKKNAQDREDRKRHSHESHRGARNPKAKLTEEQVVEIKADLAAGEAQVSIASRFLVSPQTISAIAVGRRWAHVV